MIKMKSFNFRHQLQYGTVTKKDSKNYNDHILGSKFYFDIIDACVQTNLS